MIAGYSMALHKLLHEQLKKQKVAYLEVKANTEN